MEWKTLVKFDMNEIYSGQESIEAVALTEVTDDFRQAEPTMEVKQFILDSVVPDHVEAGTNEIYFLVTATVVLSSFIQ